MPISPISVGALELLAEAEQLSWSRIDADGFEEPIDGPISASAGAVLIARIPVAARLVGQNLASRFTVEHEFSDQQSPWIERVESQLHPLANDSAIAELRFEISAEAPEVATRIDLGTLWLGVEQHRALTPPAEVTPNSSLWQEIVDVPLGPVVITAADPIDPGEPGDLESTPYLNPVIVTRDHNNREGLEPWDAAFVHYPVNASEQQSIDGSFADFAVHFTDPDFLAGATYYGYDVYAYWTPEGHRPPGPTGLGFIGPHHFTNEGIALRRTGDHRGGPSFELTLSESASAHSGTVTLVLVRRHDDHGAAWRTLPVWAWFAFGAGDSKTAPLFSPQQLPGFGAGHQPRTWLPAETRPAASAFPGPIAPNSLPLWHEADDETAEPIVVDDSAPEVIAPEPTAPEVSSPDHQESDPAGVFEVGSETDQNPESESEWLAPEFPDDQSEVRGNELD